MEDGGQTYEKNVETERAIAFADGEAPPGFGTDPEFEGTVKWMGGDPEAGPWIYWVVRPAGTVIPPHRHAAARVEFIVDGAIEWHEGDDARAWFKEGAPTGTGVRYEQGSLTWVPAGHVYGYRMLEDTSVLLWFDGPPRGTNWST